VSFAVIVGVPITDGTSTTNVGYAANAKSLFRDMYHGIKDEFLQEYLNEFCYKFNRRYFFDRLIIAAVSYRPTFEHRMYGSVSPKCG